MTQHGSSGSGPAAGDPFSLAVHSLSGDVVLVTACGSMLGRDLQRIVSQQVRPEAGACLCLQHGRRVLAPDGTLLEQGITENTANVSYTKVCAGLAQACRCAQQLHRALDFTAFGAIREVHNCFENVEELRCLPDNLESLTLSPEMHASVEQLQTLPPNLRSLSLGDAFDDELRAMVWPQRLERIRFGHDFNRPLQRTALPSGLLEIHIDGLFDMPIDNVPWPLGLLELSLGPVFSWDLKHVALPSSLLALRLGASFRSSFLPLVFPLYLKTLVLDCFLIEVLPPAIFQRRCRK